MNSEFLSTIGMGSIDIGYILLGLLIILLILIILVIVQITKFSKLKKRYEKFMRGKNAASLENDIADIFQDMKFLKTSVEKNKKDIRVLYKNMESTFQKVGIIKYDAFNQMGGKLSFSLALLDENDNGFILNSVHSSDGCYSYTKIIKNGGKSHVEFVIATNLGEEEKQALDMAMGLDD